MNFKTKDLLVTVLPKADDAKMLKFCLLQTFVCGYPTFQCACTLRPTLHCNPTFYCGPCSFLSCAQGTCGPCSLLGTVGGCGILNSCGPGFSACDPTIACPGGSFNPFVIQNMGDLATLRTELQETLKQLDTIQKEGLPSQFASKAEAEAVEQGLNEALKQVREAKERLPKK